MRLRWRGTLPAVTLAVALAISGCSNRLSDTDSQAVQGISEDTIKIGSSLPQSGPLAVFRLYGVGANAYFNYLNSEHGGIDGRKIDFTVYDDGGTPARTVENARRLINQDEVFALAFVFGSANNLAIRELANESETPQLYVNSGLPDFGSPAGIEEYPYTIGWLPPYNLEAAAHAEYLKETQPDAKVAVLYQNDDLGSSLLNGFKESIQDTGIEIVETQSYNLSDPTVSSQMAVLARSGADVFLNYSQSTFTTQAIKAKAQLGWDAQMVLPTFDASPAILEPAGLENSSGAVSGVFLKDPLDPRWKNDEDLMEYRRIVTEYGGSGADPDSQQIAFGFAQGQLLAEALDAMPEPTPEALMEAVRSMEGVELMMLYPGITVSTSETDGYPLESLAIQRFDGSEWSVVGDRFDLEGRAQELSE
jgi:branched-chain amino acid transport system substrate-binding protein